MEREEGSFTRMGKRQIVEPVVVFLLRLVPHVDEALSATVAGPADQSWFRAPHLIFTGSNPAPASSRILTRTVLP